MRRMWLLSRADMVSYVRLVAPVFPRMTRLWRHLLAIMLSTADLEGFIQCGEDRGRRSPHAAIPLVLECVAISRLWKDTFPIYLAPVLQEWSLTPAWKPPAAYEDESCEEDIRLEDFSIDPSPIVDEQPDGEDPPTPQPLLSLIGEDQRNVRQSRDLSVFPPDGD